MWQCRVDSGHKPQVLVAAEVVKRVGMPVGQLPGHVVEVVAPLLQGERREIHRLGVPRRSELPSDAHRKSRAYHGARRKQGSADCHSFARCSDRDCGCQTTCLSVAALNSTPTQIYVPLIGTGDQRPNGVLGPTGLSAAFAA